MRDDKQHGDLNVEDDVLDKAFAEANPNPERVGCPPPDVLRELALKLRPIQDAGYLHLSECSPCWIEFRAAQKAAAASHRSKSAAKKIASAAAMVLLAGAGAWFFLWAPVDPRGPGNASSHGTTATAIATTIDLRPYAIQRSEQNQPAPPLLLLPRARVRATILLVVGSEPGPYQVQVLDADMKTRASATGAAVIRDFITTLEAELDLRALTPGAYQLGVRREDEDWRLFSAQVTQAQDGRP